MTMLFDALTSLYKFHFIYFCVKLICVLFFQYTTSCREKKDPDHHTW